MKSKKVEFDDRTEALVRKTLSDAESKIQALSLWLTNSLEEWKWHDSMFFGFQVRVKSVSSAVEKAKDLCEKKGVIFRDQQDVKDNINDIVGARIIAYSHGKILSLHDEIISHKRFHVTNARLHYRSKDSKKNFVEDLIVKMTPSKENKAYLFEKEENENGYTDAHYLIQPKAYDKCYDSVDIYEKFELQVRTTTQHAWAEMQHQNVYKSINSNNKETKKYFEELVDIVNQFDVKLNYIINSSKVSTPSNREAEIIDKDSFIICIESLIDKFDEKDDKTNKKELALEAFNKFSQELDLILVNDKSFEYRLEVCLLALKANLFKRAEVMLQKYIFNDVRYDCSTLNYEWALLRKLENLRDLRKENEAKEAVVKLLECVKAKKYQVHTNLLTNLSLVLWEHNFFFDAKEIAEKILASNKAKCDVFFKVRTMLNLVYYNTEITYSQREFGYKKQDKIVAETFAIVKEALSLIESKNISLTPNMFDSLAFYFYIRGEFFEKNDKELALEANSLAKNYLNECFSKWESLNDNSRPDQVWIEHEVEIKSQLIRLEEDE